MDMQRFLTAGFLSSLGMWLLSGLWHEVIAVEFYAKAHGGKGHEGVLFIVAAYLVLGFLMTYLYELMRHGSSVLWEGLRLGGLAGILWVFPHGLLMAGAHGRELDYVFINSAWHIVEQGFGGVIITYWYWVRSKER